MTYKQAAVVQPFANTLVNMKMTGAQIKTVLEQQWQRDASGNGPVPSVPAARHLEGLHLHLRRRPGAEGNRITGMWLNGKAIDAGTTYSVTVNSFLASGGDNFRGLHQGHRQAGHRQGRPAGDGGLHGRQREDDPLPVDQQQHFVGYHLARGRPRFYRIGQNVDLSLSSLAMTGPNDPKDAKLNIKVGDETLDPTPVDNSLGDRGLRRLRQERGRR